MATQHIVVTNTGKGFINHDDQETDGLAFAGHSSDVYAVTGTTAIINAWKTRVSGTSDTKVATQSIIDASLVGILDDQDVQVVDVL